MLHVVDWAYGYYKRLILGSVVIKLVFFLEDSMNLFKSIKYAALALMFTPVMALAGVVTTTYESRTQTTGYVGLQWLLGEKEQSAVPNVVVGARYTKTNTSNRVSGADLSLTYDFSKSQVGSVRLGYLGGKCDLLGTAGIGYDYANKALLGYLGAIGPYSKVFGQIGGQGFGLGLEVNTQDCAKDRKEIVTVPDPA
jgi:hypothetical protein